MTDSLNLRHFPERDPAGTTEKARMRSELERHVGEYLAAGGEIKDVGNQSGVEYPVRRTRRAQINFLRKKDFGRTKRR